MRQRQPRGARRRRHPRGARPPPPRSQGIALRGSYLMLNEQSRRMVDRRRRRRHNVYCPRRLRRDTKRRAKYRIRLATSILAAPWVTAPCGNLSEMCVRVRRMSTRVPLQPPPTAAVRPAAMTTQRRLARVRPLRRRRPQDYMRTSKHRIRLARSTPAAPWVTVQCGSPVGTSVRKTPTRALHRPSVRPGVALTRPHRPGPPGRLANRTNHDHKT